MHRAGKLQHAVACGEKHSPARRWYYVLPRGRWSTALGHLYKRFASVYLTKKVSHFIFEAAGHFFIWAERHALRAQSIFGNIFKSAMTWQIEHFLRNI
jgi:hypothetical protein